MTPEDEEFNRIEREAKLRMEAVSAALDKKAQNARELGLDYEPAQQEPVAWMEMVVANLVREGVNKHKARELAQHFYTSPPAQRTWVGLDWLPEHKCGLHLSHNEHRDVYETIHDFYDADDFISPEEWHEAVPKDSVWVLHWYPETPIGFSRLAASTLEALEAKLREKNT
jgi:hypothetical protein